MENAELGAQPTYALAQHINLNLSRETDSRISAAQSNPIPKNLRVHISRKLGPKAILYKGFR